MKLEFSDEENAFRAEVREFIENNAPEGMTRDMASEGDVDPEEMREKMLAWHKTLGKKGWSVPSWPVVNMAVPAGIRPSAISGAKKMRG